MRNFTFGIIILAMLAFLLNGCGHHDADVTLSPEYNFSPFAGTVWKTKVKVALADIKRYTGEHQLNLLAPRRFDPTVPDYAPVNGAKIITILPVGTVLRIERFMINKDIGADTEVKARLQNGAYAQREVNVDEYLLAKNRYIWPGVSSTNWGVDPDMLTLYEAVAAPPQSEITSSNATDTRDSGYEQGYNNGKKQGIFVAKFSRPGTDFSELSDPWQRDRELKPWAVKIHGEDYVAEYELGYSKGFQDYSKEKQK